MGIRITEDRVVSDSETTLEIVAKDISASEINPRIGGRKIVLVHADVLRLDSPIVAPGAAVTLIARKALGGKQAVINVSGVDGVDALQSPPPTPLETSSPAPNGSNGGDAGVTGSIDVLFKELDGPLVLMAVGGRGGKAQPGANGANGKHGFPHDEIDTEGGAGGDAGAPGRAGIPGTSGNGGQIRIHVDSGGELVTAQINGGEQVAGSAHGKPGAPGEGGLGGRIEVCVPSPGVLSTGAVPLRWGMDCGISPDRRASGPRGKDASPILDPVPVGKAGNPGSVTLGRVFGHPLSIPVKGLKLLALDADMTHLQGNEVEAADKASWLFAISSEAADTQARELRMRLASTLGRIASGLPPVGIQGVYCSMRPIEFHLDSLQKRLESRFRFRYYLAEMRAENLQVETVQKAVNDVLYHAELVTNLGKVRKEQLDSRLKDVSNQLDSMAASYVAIWLKVQTADHDFKEAVARKNPCGSFLNVLIAVSLVVATVASGGATAASALAGGAEAFKWLNKDSKTQKDYKGLIEDANEVKTTLDGIAKGANDLADFANKAKDFLGGDDLQPPSDEVRVSMTRDDFNKMIEPYKGMAEADRLRLIMDQFFAMVDARNSLLIERTQLITELASIRSAITTAQRQRDDLEKSEGSVLLTKVTDVYEAAMWADLEFGKGQLAALAEANSAFEYEWIQLRAIDLSSTRPEHIERQYELMLDDRRHTPVDVSLNAICEIRIDRDSHKEVFEHLASDRAFVTLMPTNIPKANRNRWDERAFSLGIQLEFNSEYLAGKEISTRAMLTSTGISWFKPEKGPMLALKVPKRSASCKASSKLDLNLIYEERNFMDVRTDVVEVSPYGLWSLQLPGISEHLPKLEAIRFIFVGSARHSPETRVAFRQYGPTLLKNLGSKSKVSAPGILGMVEIAAKDEPVGMEMDQRIQEAIQLKLVEDGIFLSRYAKTLDEKV